MISWIDHIVKIIFGLGKILHHQNQERTLRVLCKRMPLHAHSKLLKMDNAGKKNPRNKERISTSAQVFNGVFEVMKFQCGIEDVGLTGISVQCNRRCDAVRLQSILSTPILGSQEEGVPAPYRSNS